MARCGGISRCSSGWMATREGRPRGERGESGARARVAIGHAAFTGSVRGQARRVTIAPHPRADSAAREPRNAYFRLEKPSDLFEPEALLERPNASLMVLAPHPDDESLAAGGLIQRALARGARVSVAFVTDGENNPWPQRALERRLWIGPPQRAEWGRRRRMEAEAALRELGAERITVHRLGWPDGGVTWMLLEQTGSMIAAMRGLLEREQPSLLVLPDLVDRHPDHRAIHVLMEMVFQSMA